MPIKDITTLLFMLMIFAAFFIAGYFYCYYRMHS